MTAGILAVDKPAGPTSHDVVRVARRALGTRRVGHFGTLDPFASGLLVINTISTIVLEQRPQIGSMKAIGASTQQIMLTYLVLALLPLLGVRT